MNDSKMRAILESALQGEELVGFNVTNVVAEITPVDGWQTYKATGERVITIRTRPAPAAKEPAPPNVIHVEVYGAADGGEIREALIRQIRREMGVKL